jgi:TFIIF-interacting CTD phosphatase-like protein
MKDFGVIANRNIEDLIMIDNLIYSYALNLENGVLIKPYFDGQDDRELQYIADVLDKLQNYEDVRTFIQNNFRLNSFYSYLRGLSKQY